MYRTLRPTQRGARGGRKDGKPSSSRAYRALSNSCSRVKKKTVVITKAGSNWQEH